jgi:hypothetical protein
VTTILASSRGCFFQGEWNLQKSSPTCSEATVPFGQSRALPASPGLKWHLPGGILFG